MNTDYLIAIAAIFGPGLFFMAGWIARSLAYRREWQETVEPDEPQMIDVSQLPDEFWRRAGRRN